MDQQLDPTERRILGVLIEKQMTVPDTYPMTLNGIAVGASQKSNRDPYRSFHEWEIEGALKALIERGLVAFSDHHMGGRTRRYSHRLSERLSIDSECLAVLGELLLRGPQQPGELRTRAERMIPIQSQETLAAILEKMTSMTPPLVVRHIRRSGERAERYSQTLASDNDYLGITETSLPPFRPTANPLAALTPDSLGTTGAVATIVSSLPTPITLDIVRRLDAIEAELLALKARLDAAGA